MNSYSDHSILVGGFNPSEKYESQIGSSSQLLRKIKKCSKPPTSNLYIFVPQDLETLET
jgi:hypothetical protein